MWVKSTITAFCLTILLASPAWACSVTSDYVRPSNFELVQMADAIVVATAADEQQQSDADHTVRFDVDSTIKGPAPETVTFPDGRLAAVAPSDPHNLQSAHPEAYAGPCNRMTFERGKQYVLFLEHSDEGYLPIGIPFSRVSEDYFGEESLWVRTIRTYLDIQRRNAPMAQIEAMDRLMHESAGVPRTPDREALARDVFDHLTSRSPWKPTAYLVETYEALERGEPIRYALRLPQADRENSPADAMTDLLFGTSTARIDTKVQQETFVLRALVLGDHADAAPLFERIVASPDVSAPQLGFAIRFFAKNGRYRRAYGLIEQQAMARMPRLSRDDALSLVGDIAAAQRGESYEEGQERWRTDPYVASRWPELALQIHSYEVRMFGADYAAPFDDAIKEIRVADFNTRPDVTLALARELDSDVEAWAIRELSDTAILRDWEQRLGRREGSEGADPDQSEDPALLALRALMLGYGEERDVMLKRVFCQGDRRREELILMLGEEGGELDGYFAAQIAASAISDDHRKELGQAVALMFARQAGRRSDGGLLNIGAGDEEYELLEKTIRHERVDADPIRCPR